MTRKAVTAALLALILVPVLVLGQGKRGELAGVRQAAAASSALNPGVIKGRIELYFLENYREHHDEVVLEYGELPVIDVDPLDWDINVESRRNTVRKGANLVTVTVFSRQRVYNQFIANVQLKTFDDVVVARQQVDRDVQLSRDDLALQRVESTNFKRDYFTRIDDLTGLQTKRIIQAGKPVFAAAVELPDLIRRGDLIKILIRVKNLEVTATGKALENGRLGDEIKAENLATGKKITGQIQDKKTIIVEL